MSDYATLQASILDVLGDPGLTNAHAQKFIGLAEPKLERDILSHNYGASVPYLMLAHFETQTDASNKVILPADFIRARSVKINGQRSRYASVEMVDINATGFAEADVLLDYYQRLQKLSGTVPSNWLLDVGYDAYMWGAAVQYAVWGQEMEKVNMWQTYYADAIATVREAYKSQPRGNLYRHPNKIYNSFYTISGGDLVFGNATK